MGKLSKEDRRSVACITVSYFVHLFLIIIGSCVYLGLQERGTITLTVEHNSNQDDFFFESPFEGFETEVDQAAFEALEHEETEPDPAEDWLAEPEPGLDLASLDSLPTDQKKDSGKSQSKTEQKTIGGKKRPKVNGVGFFGVEPTGQRVTFLIDVSVSMEGGYGVRRYDRAVAEVLHAVSQLNDDQEFFVYLFCFRQFEMRIGPKNQFLPPTEENINKLAKWLDGMRLGSGTDPREAIVSALKQNPHCMYLLTDGEFNGRQFRNRPWYRKATAVELAAKHNKVQCPIHTIGMDDSLDVDALIEIARQSGGTSSFVK